MWLFRAASFCTFTYSAHSPGHGPTRECGRSTLFAPSSLEVARHVFPVRQNLSRRRYVLQVLVSHLDREAILQIKQACPQTWQEPLIRSNAHGWRRAPELPVVPQLEAAPSSRLAHVLDLGTALTLLRIAIHTNQRSQSVCLSVGLYFRCSTCRQLVEPRAHHCGLQSFDA